MDPEQVRAWLVAAPVGTMVPADEFRTMVGWGDGPLLAALKPAGTLWRACSSDPPRVRWYYSKVE